MPTGEDVNRKIDTLIGQINLDQADAMSLQIAAAFVAGSDSITSTLYSEELSDQQERAIKQLSAEYFGYISEFNRVLAEQLKDEAREILRNNGGYKEISNYITQVLDGQEQVVIDHVGQTKKIIEVGRDGQLREVEKVITKKYVTTVDNYASMLGRTATHAAWADGRAVGHQKSGFPKWRFVGPVDERSSPDHCAVIGNVYEYGTPESDLALRLLHEPHCRHRAVVYFNDPELDAPQEFFEKQKSKAGLRWDEDKEKWIFKN